MRLNESTQRSWNELVDAHDGQTRIRLKEPFRLASGDGEAEISATIAQGTELMLFCNMKGARRTVRAGAKPVTRGTFFIDEGPQQISVLSDWTLRVTTPRAPTELRSEMRRGRTQREPIVITARW